MPLRFLHGRLSPLITTARNLTSTSKGALASYYSTLTKPPSATLTFHQSPILVPGGPSIRIPPTTTTTSSTTTTTTTTPPSASTTRQMSTQGYGDYSLDPISNNPQDQGPRPRIDTEHPGPEPVAEGRGKSGVKGKKAPPPEEARGTGGDGGKTNRTASLEGGRSKAKGYADDGEGGGGYGSGKV